MNARICYKLEKEKKKQYSTPAATATKWKQYKVKKYIYWESGSALKSRNEKLRQEGG